MSHRTTSIVRFARELDRRIEDLRAVTGHPARIVCIASPVARGRVTITVDRCDPERADAPPFLLFLLPDGTWTGDTAERIAAVSGKGEA